MILLLQSLILILASVYLTYRDEWALASFLVAVGLAPFILAAVSPHMRVFG